jgi:hypothetical protein
MKKALGPGDFHLPSELWLRVFRQLYHTDRLENSVLPVCAICVRIRQIHRVIDVRALSFAGPDLCRECADAGTSWRR